MKVKPEQAVQRAITDLLTVERVWWRRMQSGMLPGFAQGGKRRPIRVGTPGMADILCTPRVAVSKGQLVILWVEAKSPVGKQSNVQREFQVEVEAEGHFYLLARSSDDVKAWLKEAR